jgi:hypothetical protein
LKGKLAKVEAELLSTREALKMEQHEHYELRIVVRLVCDTLGVIQVCPGVSSLRSHLGVAFEQAQTQVKEVLHLGMWRALTVFRLTIRRSIWRCLVRATSISSRRSLTPSIKEVLEPTKTLAAKFEEEIVPLFLEL